MPKKKKNGEKPSVTVPDLPTKDDPKGGRDAASGMASGKRQYKPIQFTAEIDKSTPKL